MRLEVGLTTLPNTSELSNACEFPTPGRNAARRKGNCTKTQGIPKKKLSYPRLMGEKTKTPKSIQTRPSTSKRIRMHPNISLTLFWRSCKKSTLRRTGASVVAAGTTFRSQMCGTWCDAQPTWRVHGRMYNEYSRARCSAERYLSGIGVLLGLGTTGLCRRCMYQVLRRSWDPLSTG